ncbi:MAG: hypothetical protein ACHQTF_05310 [Gemmatimonadales bacterium]
MAALAAATLTGSLAVACSSSSTGVGSSNDNRSDTVMVAAEQTGFVESGAGDQAFASPGSDIRVGDDAARDPLIAVRGFIGFDLSTLPSGIHVQSATLVATQCAISGSPFTLGNVVVDHVTYPAPFDTTVFAQSAIAMQVGTLSTDGSIGARSVSVTSSVANDLAASRGSSQFRLRMSTDNDAGNGPSNQVIFASDSAHTLDCTPAAGQQPRLVITFLP